MSCGAEAAPSVVTVRQDRRPQSRMIIDRAVSVRVVEGRDEFGDGGIPAGEIKSVEHPNSLGYAPDTTHSGPVDISERREAKTCEDKHMAMKRPSLQVGRGGARSQGAR